MKHYLLAFALLVLPLPALAQRAVAPASELGIAAVVNDEAISNSDVEARMRLALLGAGMQPPAEALARLKAQILRSMVDERLQMQEAAKYNITVPEADIDAEVAKMAEQNHMSAAELPRFFGSKGVDIYTLREQIRAGIAWAMVVQRRLRPQVDIGDDEVDAELARVSSLSGQPQYLVAEIYLPVDNPSQEEGVKQTAQKLVEQMARGARFSAVARQFSQSASAAAGGDMGWITQGQLEPQLDTVLQQMATGTLSLPVRTASGYHILMLREKRTTPGVGAAPVSPIGADPETAVIKLQQVLVPVPRSSSSNQLLAATRKLMAMREQAKSCADMERLATDAGDTGAGRLGDIAYKDLPPALQPILRTLPESTASDPMRNDHGVLFLMVCSRSYPNAPAGAQVASAPVPTATDEQRQQITNKLGQQKLELLARRYLRDLRQNAFIDVRGG